MNLAIEKLEKEIDRYKFGIRNDEAAYILCGKYTLSLKSLKACVEALECSELLGDGGAFQLRRKEAMALVNRAMGVSHE